MSVKVIYRDVDFQIKKDLTDISVSENIVSEYMDKQFLKYVSVPAERQATLEENLWRLDGSYALPGIENEKINVGVFSSSLSSYDLTEYGYMLSESIEVIYKWDNTVSVSNITFTFDNPDYCTYMTVEGFSDEEQLNSVFIENVFPDNDIYNHKLSSIYDVILLKFTFYAMNKPNRFLKLYSVDFGQSYVFNNEDIYDVKILRETSLISDSLPIGTSEITVSNKEVTSFKKMKPVFIYKENKLERAHYITDTEELGNFQQILYCSDSLWLLDIYDEEILNKYTPQEFDNNVDIGNKVTNLVTKYIDKISAARPVNFPNYTSPYISDYSLNDLIIQYNKMLQFFIFVDDEVKTTQIAYMYNETNLKQLLLQILHANQICLNVKNNGIVCIRKKSNDIKKIFSNRIFNNIVKKTKEKINSIIYTVINKTITAVEEQFDDGTAEIDLGENNYLTFKASLWGGLQPISADVYFKQETPHSISIDVSRPSVSNQWILYEAVIFQKNNKQIMLEPIDANKKINSVEVSENLFLTVDNEENYINSLSDYYSHNSTLEFDAILEDETEGALIKVILTKKSYIGRIEKIEYTMQGKKIGTITMRVYEEVENNG